MEVRDCDHPIDSLDYNTREKRFSGTIGTLSHVSPFIGLVGLVSLIGSGRRDSAMPQIHYITLGTLLRTDSTSSHLRFLSQSPCWCTCCSVGRVNTRKRSSLCPPQLLTSSGWAFHLFGQEAYLGQNLKALEKTKWTRYQAKVCGSHARHDVMWVWVVIEGTGCTSARVSDQSLDLLSLPRNSTLIVHERTTFEL